MLSYHADPLYQRNSRTVRRRVNADLKAGRPVWCQRCGREIQLTQRYDVGHRIDASRGGTHDLDNLGPEHRGENRSAGGRLGAQKTNDAKGVSRRSKGLPTLRDEDGEPMAEEYPGQAFDALAARLAQHHAGGWAPDSIPGKQALAEFEAFVRETQARAVEEFVSHTVAVEMESGWSLSGYSDDIRQGRTDLSGRRLS